MKTPWLLACGLLLTAGLSVLAAAAADDAEEQETKPRYREEVEVRAAPIVEGTSVRHDAQAVTTVTDEQVEALGARDLAAGLRRVPGVTISRYNIVGSYGGGEGGALYLRGHGSGRPGAEIGTLVAGIPRFVGVWTHPLLDTLPLDGIARIEVHKSAQPVLLGPAAGFASVNLLPVEPPDEGHDGRLALSAGSHDTRDASVRAVGREGRLGYAVAGAHRASDGHRPGAGGRVGSLLGRVSWDLAPRWQVSAQVQRADGWADDPGAVGAPPRPITPRFATRDTFGLATLERHGERISLAVRAYLDDGAIDWRQWTGQEQTSVTRWANHGLRARLTTRPWTGGTLVAGLDHDTYGGETFIRTAAGAGPVTDLDLRNRAAYALLSHRFERPAFSLTPSVGLRVNDSRDFGTNEGWQVGLRFERPKTTVYAHRSRAFNLAGVWAAVLYGGFGRGDEWRGLEPELLDHTEVGLVRQLGRSFEVHAALYRDEAEDALRFTFAAGTGPPRFTNVGAYSTDGAEATLTWYASPRLSLFVGGAALDPEPSELPYAPEWSWSVGLHARPHARVTLDLDAEGSAERFVGNPRFWNPVAPAGPAADRVDGYTVVSGRATWRPGGARLRLFVQGENLLDEDYAFRPGYPMPGRTFFGGLELDL